MRPIQRARLDRQAKSSQSGSFQNLRLPNCATSRKTKTASRRMKLWTTSCAVVLMKNRTWMRFVRGAMRQNSYVGSNTCFTSRSINAAKLHRASKSAARISVGIGDIRSLTGSAMTRCTIVGLLAQR